MGAGGGARLQLQGGVAIGAGDGARAAAAMVAPAGYKVGVETNPRHRDTRSARILDAAVVDFKPADLRVPEPGNHLVLCDLQAGQPCFIGHPQPRIGVLRDVVRWCERVVLAGGIEIGGGAGCFGGGASPRQQAVGKATVGIGGFHRVGVEHCPHIGVVAGEAASSQFRGRQQAVVGSGNGPALGHKCLAGRLVVGIGKADVFPDRCAVAGRCADSPLLLSGLDRRAGIEIVRIEVGDLIDMDVVGGESFDRLARHSTAVFVADEVVGERILGTEGGEHESEIDHRGKERVARGARPAGGGFIRFQSPIPLQHHLGRMGGVGDL